MSTPLHQTRRRHHYIPRFLLKRFASRKEGKKSWIWQMRKNEPPREIRIRDAAVAKFFYGNQDNIEERIWLAENGFAVALRSIDNGVPPALLHHQLRQFVWFQSVRTKAMRQHWHSSVDKMIVRTLSAMASDHTRFRDLCLKYARRNLEDLIKSVCKHLSFVQQTMVWNMLRQPGGRKWILDVLEAQLSSQDITPMISLFQAALIRMDVVATSLARGQHRAFSKMLNQDGLIVPEHFQPRSWQIVKSTEHSRWILSDVCVMAKDLDAAEGPLFKFGNSWSELYLPISPDRALFAAAAEKAMPSLGVELVNRLSARSAFSYVFTSRIDEEEGCYATQIGEDPVLTEEEMVRLIGDAFSERILAGKAP